jgi:hypothetical protein
MQKYKRNTYRGIRETNTEGYEKQIQRDMRNKYREIRETSTEG